MHNTIYIAEPIFSEIIQKFDGDVSFPPVKKIGITTGHPARRERELLGTKSPVKISIVRAWTDIDARKVESMLHAILDNARLDGEYFWDGNETLVDAVSAFIKSYHPEATLIRAVDEADVVAASEALKKKRSQRIYTEVVPRLRQLAIDCAITANGRGARFRLGEYWLVIGGRSSDRYTMTIWSKTRTTEQAIADFEHAQELSSNSLEDSDRRARVPMVGLEMIVESISNFVRVNGG